MRPRAFGSSSSPKAGQLAAGVAAHADAEDEPAARQPVERQALAGQLLAAGGGGAA